MGRESPDPVPVLPWTNLLRIDPEISLRFVQHVVRMTLSASRFSQFGDLGFQGDEVQEKLLRFFKLVTILGGRHLTDKGVRSVVRRAIPDDPSRVRADQWRTFQVKTQRPRG